MCPSAGSAAHRNPCPPGVTLNGCFDAAVDGPSLASLAVVCTDRTSDVFFVKAVADTKTEMINKDGNGIGASLTRKRLARCYATAASTFGLNEDGAGVGFYYVESAEGQLKGAFPAQSRGSNADPFPINPGTGPLFSKMIL